MVARYIGIQCHSNRSKWHAREKNYQHITSEIVKLQQSGTVNKKKLTKKKSKTKNRNRICFNVA